MEKRISYDEFMAVKRVAQAVNPLTVKKDKIVKKLEALKAEYDSYDGQIAALEAGIRQLTGFRVNELVKKVIEPAVNENGIPKTDKDGKALKVTKYIPTDIVSYDKENKQYVIAAAENLEKPEEEAGEEAENTETVIA